MFLKFADTLWDQLKTCLTEDSKNYVIELSKVFDDLLFDEDKKKNLLEWFEKLYSELKKQSKKKAFGFAEHVLKSYKKMYENQQKEFLEEVDKYLQEQEVKETLEEEYRKVKEEIERGIEPEVLEDIGYKIPEELKKSKLTQKEISVLASFFQ